MGSHEDNKLEPNPLSLFGLGVKVVRRHHLTKRAGSGSTPAASTGVPPVVNSQWADATSLLGLSVSYLAGRKHPPGGVLDHVCRERFVVPAGGSPAPAKVVPAWTAAERRFWGQPMGSGRGGRVCLAMRVLSKDLGETIRPGGG